MDGYRKELKFIVGDDVLTDVRCRISPLMRYDEHQAGDHYNIRSIYFDSPARTCLAQNLAGVSPREKYRIRTYNGSSDVIKAEIKIRHRDAISKMSAPIDTDMFEALVLKGSFAATVSLSGMINGSSDRSGRVFEKYLARIMNDMYLPVCIVEYERTAFVYDIGNVRVTFDRNITASTETDRMFAPYLAGRSVLSGNRHILEIKYDEFLPDEIRQVLGGLGLERCSCSKYALGCVATAEG